MLSQNNTAETKKYQTNGASYYEPNAQNLKNNQQVDFHEVSNFLAAFYPNEKETVCLRTFPAKDTSGKKCKGFPRNFETTRFELERDAKIQRILIDANVQNGVYFVVNAGGHDNDSITRFNALFVESDTITIAQQHERFDAESFLPAVRVVTNKSVHGHFLLDEPAERDLPDLVATRNAEIIKQNTTLTAWNKTSAGERWKNEFELWKRTPESTKWQRVAERWKTLQTGLIDYFGGDNANKNESRVMRLPFFNHVTFDLEQAKYIYKPVVLHTFENKRCSFAQLEHAFSKQPQTVPQKLLTDNAPQPRKERCLDLPVNGFTNHDSNGKITDGRNQHLIRIAGTMRKSGLSEDAIKVALLTESETRFAEPYAENQIVDIANRYAHQSNANGEYRDVSSAGDNDLPRGFELNERDVIFSEIKQRGQGDKAESEIVKTPVCSHLKVLATTRNADGESWGRMLEIVDADGKKHNLSLPLNLLETDYAEFRSRLVNHGLRIF